MRTNFAQLHSHPTEMGEESGITNSYGVVCCSTQDAFGNQGKCQKHNHHRFVQIQLSVVRLALSYSNRIKVCCVCVCVCSCDYAMYRAFYEIDNTLQYIMYVKYIPSLFNVFTLHPVASFRVNRVVSIIWWVDCRRRTMLSSHNTLEMLLCELDSHTHIVHKNTFVRHCHPMKSMQNWFDDGKER